MKRLALQIHRERPTRLLAGLALVASLIGVLGALLVELDSNLALTSGLRTQAGGSAAGTRILLGDMRIPLSYTGACTLAWFAARRGGRTAPWIANLLAFLPGLLFALAGSTSAGLAILALLLSALGGWRQRSAVARHTLLFGAPLAALLALALAPSKLGLGALPVAFFAALAAHLWTRSRGALALTSVERLRRLLVALGVTIALGALLPVVHLAIAKLPNPVPLRWQDSIHAGAPRTPLSTSEGKAQRLGSDEALEFRGVFPDQLNLQGRPDALEHEELLTVRPRAGSGRPATLYLRGLTLEEFGPQGVRSQLGAFETLRDADDGREDGWVRLVPASETPSTQDLEIDALALTVGRSTTAPLFVTRDTVALRIGELGRSASGLAVESAGPRLRYGLRYGPRQANGAAGTRTSVSAAELERCLALPEDPTVAAPLEYIAERALKLVGAHASLTAREKIERVLAGFERFEYALVSTDQPGLFGVVDFLERRRGHCSYFAMATALSLRALGVPARVVTGFLAEQWDSERGLFAVSVRNGHAWVEAYTPAEGWIRVEATPATQRTDFLMRLDPDAPASLSAWTREAAFEFELWVRTGGREPSLGSLAGTLARGADTLGQTLLHMGQRMWLALTLGLLTLTFLLWRRGRWGVRFVGSRQEQSSPPATPEAARDELTSAALAKARAELFGALAAAGFQRPPARTASEFTADLRAQHEARTRLPLERISGLIERLEGARWGRRPFATADRQVLRALARDLRRQA